MNISRKRLYIDGMTCVNCQNKIEQVLKKTPGVESAKVSYQKGTADIAFDPDWVTLEELRQVIRGAGYEVLLEPAVRKPDFGRTATLLILIFFLYRMLQHSGILNFWFRVNLRIPDGIWDAFSHWNPYLGALHCHVRGHQSVPVHSTERRKKRTADLVHFGLADFV